MTIRDLFALCSTAVLLAGCSSDSQAVRPILPDEYAVASKFIHHIILKEGKNSRFPSITVMIDTTTGDGRKQSFQFADEALFGQGGLARQIASVSSDAFQLVAIKRDYSERMEKSYSFAPDSIRSRLLRAIPLVADTIYVTNGHPSPPSDDNEPMVEQNRLCIFQLSRVGFNPTLDQAMAILYYSNGGKYARYDACFKKENQKWTVVFSWAVKRRDR